MLYSLDGCSCAGEALNPGQTGCVPKVGRDLYPIYVQYRNSDGDINVIPKGTVIDQTYVENKLNETDLTKRWFVFPQIWNVQQPMPEDEVETIDNVDFKTGDEIKQAYSYEHVSDDANPALIAVYNSFDCKEMGVFYITNKGQLNGMHDGNGGLAPIKQQKGTISAKYAPPSTGVVQKIMVRGFVSDDEYDANRDYITSQSISYPTNSWFLSQPVQVTARSISNAAQTTIVIDLNGLRGQVYDKVPITGLVSNDFSYDNGTTPATVYNVTTAASVSVTVAEDSVDTGRYTLTLAAAQTAADVIKIDIFKTGYYMQSVEVTLV